jgi:hypothetical protein
MLLAGTTGTLAVQALPAPHNPANPLNGRRFEQPPNNNAGFYIKDYCQGTGSGNGGVDCPCGNTAPPGSMEGCVNQSGFGAALTHTGTPSVSNDTFVLTVTGIPLGLAGYFFDGAGANGGTTFGNGERCISGPIIRLHKVAHSSGSDMFPAPGTPPISQQLNLSSGDASFFQVVYRDHGGPCGGGVNASNAVMVIWGP